MLVPLPVLSTARAYLSGLAKKSQRILDIVPS